MVLIGEAETLKECTSKATFFGAQNCLGQLTKDIIKSLVTAVAESNRHSSNSQLDFKPNLPFIDYWQWLVHQNPEDAQRCLLRYLSIVRPLMTISLGKETTSVVRSGLNHSLGLSVYHKVIDIVAEPTIQYYRTGVAEEDGAFINIPHIHPGTDMYGIENLVLRRMYNLTWQLTFLYGHTAIKMLEKWTTTSPSLPSRLELCKEIVNEVQRIVKRSAEGQEWSRSYQAAIKDLEDFWFDRLKKYVSRHASFSPDQPPEKKNTRVFSNVDYQRLCLMG